MSKKKHHEGHGGAWKVAYADFVTAMMALFMVLWISAQQKEILLATSKYFQNPFTSPMPASSGVMNNKKERPMIEQNGTASKTFTAEMYMALANEFLKMLDVNDPVKRDGADTRNAIKSNKAIDIRVVADGIVISLFNRDNQPLFEKGSAKTTPWGEYCTQNLAWIIDRFKLNVRVQAYAASDAVAPSEDRDNWDLTTDQANVIRRRLVHYGLDASKIDRVIGFGDSKPQPEVPSTDTSNSRIELVLSASLDTPAPSVKKIKP